MSVKKTYLKSKNVCRVTFSLPAEEAGEVYVVGDFNEWDKQATPMKKGKQGFSATVELEPGREYQFRYLVNGEQWLNENEADYFCETCYPDTQNGVLVA